MCKLSFYIFIAHNYTSKYCICKNTGYATLKLNCMGCMRTTYCFCVKFYFAKDGLAGNWPNFCTTEVSLHMINSSYSYIA